MQYLVQRASFTAIHSTLWTRPSPLVMNTQFMFVHRKLKLSFENDQNPWIWKFEVCKDVNEANFKCNYVVTFSSGSRTLQFRLTFAALLACFDDRFPLRGSSGGENGAIIWLCALNQRNAFSWYQITTARKFCLCIFGCRAPSCERWAMDSSSSGVLSQVPKLNIQNIFV